MGSRRLYLDTNLYIYLLEEIEPYRQRMADVTVEIDRRDIAVIASELIFTELLPRPVSDGRRHLVERYLASWDST